jgi:hypothetical protein
MKSKTYVEPTRVSCMVSWVGLLSVFAEKDV